MLKNNLKHIDCTLRDGGYYNNWDFDSDLIREYLNAMTAINIDFVEIGFRSLKNNGFKGGCAFSTDKFIQSLNIPNDLKNKIGVMVNGSELIAPEINLDSDHDKSTYQINVLKSLFEPKTKSAVTLVRIACHFHEFEDCLPASIWLKKQGYKVGFNLMQIAEQKPNKIMELATIANDFPIDVLYFADSMGSLSPNDIRKITTTFQGAWKGELGIHAHDNMGLAISNTIQAIEDGITWIDSTVTGMGRGPGNTQTEFLTIAIEHLRETKGNPTKLFELARNYFTKLQKKYGWGTNPYYYIAGKYGIHPSYIQEMLSDHRYNEEEIISVIEHLKVEGGKKFNLDNLETARHFFSGSPRGNWQPIESIKNRDVLIVGTGPGIKKYKTAIENYIEQYRPYVIALNTEQGIKEHLIDIRAACHPVRLLADCKDHLKLSQPLVTPASMIPYDVKNELASKTLYDFGLTVEKGSFEFYERFCTVPSPLVFSYALAIATSGKANQIQLVGFDGYSSDDPRTKEMDSLINQYKQAKESISIISLTPTKYNLKTQSIYAQKVHQ